jgi:ribosome-associated protein
MNDLPLDPYPAIASRHLSFFAVRSSGPGGQHVNKTASKVVLRFDLESCESLDTEERARVRARLASRLDRAGRVQVDCQASRSQHHNLEEARAVLAALLLEALHVDPARVATKASRAAHRRRLKAKKSRGELKSQRGRVNPSAD